jgi:hypothetical protein
MLEKLNKHVADAVEQALDAESLFRCPVLETGVHGFLVEEIPSDDPNSYEPVICLSCGLVHLVNFKTRKTVGERGGD